jgi:T4 RnlA family RNA ligase
MGGISMTLHYEFPTIRNLSDVMPAIDGCPEFIVVQKDSGITLVRYVLVGKNTFPSVSLDDDISDDVRAYYENLAALRRECRGLVFNTETGELIARRFHKFFNLGEREDTQTIDLSRPHVILEKLDGSMVTPIEMPEGGIRWGTKMGITTTSMPAENFVASRQNYIDFAQLMLDRDRTPIFEWCSNQQRIVIDHPEDRLVLLAVRENESGRYLSRDVLTGWSEAYGIPLVNAFDGVFAYDSVLEVVRAGVGTEGVVIQFDDGHMVKVKSDWYVSLHRAKARIETRESDVLKLVLEEKLDDILPLLSDDDKARVRKFTDHVHHDIHQFALKVLTNISAAKQGGFDRSAFEKFPVDARATRAACYGLWDTTDHAAAMEWVTNNILRQYPIGNATYIRKIKPILPNANWREKEI